MSQRYVYAIYDPRHIDNDGQPTECVYIGSSSTPWTAVERHLVSSSNTELFEWSNELHSEFPEGLEILGKIVVDQFHGEVQKLPEPLADGRTRVPWRILGIDYGVGDVDEDSKVIRVGSLKTYWIDTMKKSGHPLLNEELGRPKVIHEDE